MPGCKRPCRVTTRSSAHVHSTPKSVIRSSRSLVATLWPGEPIDPMTPSRSGRALRHLRSVLVVTAKWSFAPGGSGWQYPSLTASSSLSASCPSAIAHNSIPTVHHEAMPASLMRCTASFSSHLPPSRPINPAALSTSSAHTGLPPLLGKPPSRRSSSTSRASRTREEAETRAAAALADEALLVSNCSTLESAPAAVDARFFLAMLALPPMIVEPSSFAPHQQLTERFGWPSSCWRT